MDEQGMALDEMRTERDHIMPLPSEIRRRLTDSRLTCTQCSKSARLTEAEARVWRNAEEALGIKPYCACGGKVKFMENKNEEHHGTTHPTL